MASQMKRKAYLLVFLTIWAQFDDALLTPASTFQSAPLPADDDDDFLPVKRPAHQDQFARRQPLSVGVKPLAANFTFVQRRVPSESKLTAPFTPAPLALFMSLQI
jgi:hypothetical protein